MIELVERLLQGERRALARLLTMVENAREGSEDALAALFPHTGNAWIVGITGAPGTGKSSLVNMLAKAYRASGRTVGILCVDPTSPFSGGAVLGDRIRMRDLAGDSGVFIRSMASRGSLGGLARTTRDCVRVMDAGGFDVVIVETVGAGQSEIDIVRMALTTVVVDAPGLGDDVQAIKAGILEIADVLVVNKVDRPGAANTVRGLKTMLELGHPAARGQLVAHHGQLLEVQRGDAVNHDAPMWIPPIIETVATKGQGVDQLLTAIDDHRQFLQQSNILTQLERQQIELELHQRLQETLLLRLLRAVPQQLLSDAIAAIQAREIDPQQAVSQILAAQHAEQS